MASRKTTIVSSPPELEIPPMPPPKQRVTIALHTANVRRMRKPTNAARSPQPPGRGGKMKGKGAGNGKGQDKNERKELEKKMNTLHKTNEKLREKSTKLGEELTKLREEENAMEQERDRLQQLWMISRSEGEEEREARHSIEKAMHRMTTGQAKSTTQLQQKMRSLLLAAKTQRIAATQTETVFVGGPLEERAVQTVDELTREKAAVQLRQNDAMLTKLIEDLEREKMNAQSDLKYAIVQLEQRMKEERENELRKLREEKLRHLEEVSALHAEELKSMEDEKNEQMDEASENITRLEEEVATLEEERDQLRIEVEMRKGRQDRAEEETHRWRREKERMEYEYNKLVARSEAVKRDAALMEKMKREIAKYKEINEILMGEYSKLEEERDSALNAMERGVSTLQRVNTLNQQQLHIKLANINQSF